MISELTDPLYFLQGVVRVRKRVTKMVVAVSIIYGLCWTPDIVIFTSILFSSKVVFGGAADITSIVLVACNSTVNPIVYAFLNNQFRNKIKGLLCGTGVVKNRVHVTTRAGEGLCSQQLKCSENVQVLSSSVQACLVGVIFFSLTLTYERNIQEFQKEHY